MLIEKWNRARNINGLKDRARNINDMVCNCRYGSGYQAVIKARNGQQLLAMMEKMLPKLVLLEHHNNMAVYSLQNPESLHHTFQTLSQLRKVTFAFNKITELFAFYRSSVLIL